MLIKSGSLKLMETSEHVQDLHYFALTVFVALGMRSARIVPKNGEPTVDFSVTTMPQHTGRDYLTKNNMTMVHLLYPHNMSPAEHNIKGTMLS
jgi:hypothetical protein